MRKMETVEIEEKLYTALISNETLMDLLANADKSIFHYIAPEVFPELPLLVYSIDEDVPVVHGDNLEKLHRVTIRIHIVYGENDYSQIYSEIKNIMHALGFTRVNTTPYKSYDGVRMLVTDFEIILEA